MAHFDEKLLGTTTSSVNTFRLMVHQMVMGAASDTLVSFINEAKRTSATKTRLSFSW